MILLHITSSVNAVPKAVIYIYSKPFFSFNCLNACPATPTYMTKTLWLCTTVLMVLTVKVMAYTVTA